MNFEVKNGSFGYNKKNLLYNNINFKLYKGEILAILGANGSGKTTLLKCMMGFLPWTTGFTLIDGTPIQSIKEKELWKMISYVPQAKGDTCAFTAEEMILLGCSSYINMYSQPKESDEEAVLESMKLLNIIYLKGKKCNEMSGGELQMVLIARALVSNPKLIILDEPESNLDFKNQLMILETIKMLVKTKKIMCIINTHYPQHALKIADKTLMIDKKEKTTLVGTTLQTITKEHLEKVFNVKVCMKEFIEKETKHQVIIPLGTMH